MPTNTAHCPKSINWSFVFSILFLLFSCGKNSVEENEFEKYLTEVHNYKQAQQIRNIFFIPVSSCDFCKDKMVDFIVSHEKISDETLIVLGAMNIAETYTLQNRLAKYKKRVLIDKGSQYMRYDFFQINSPFFAYYDQDLMLKKVEVNAKNYLENIKLLQLQLN